MPGIVLTVLQGLFLLLLYIFVARAVRWVIQDVNQPVSTATGRPPAPRPTTSPLARRRSRPRELVIHTPGAGPRVLNLEEGQTITFGRHETATVVLDDPYASDFHARIHHDGSNWIIIDEGSTNGTYVNQSRVTDPTPLHSTDQISFGRTSVEVRR